MVDISKFITFIMWVSIGYLCGSIPTGYWIGRLKGIDLTKIGSGSTGATNVLRTLGKGPALITFTIDIVKGFLPVYFCSKFVDSSFIVVVVGLICLLGHSKSIFLGFKGGKSSATGLGVVAAFSWEIALITIVLWALIVYTSKYSSVGSIIAVPLVPLWFFLFHRPLPYIIFGILAASYIVGIRHKDNIKRLLNGTEPKIGQKKSDDKQ
jgi:glycerol-3-phosphate acyltransferase PlsY